MPLPETALDGLRLNKLFLSRAPSRRTEGRDRKGDLVAKKGDLIVINAQRVGGPPREGEIIEVIEGDLRVRYRVRWRDGHETLLAPAAGVARIKSASAGKRTSSEGPKRRKSTSKRTASKPVAKRLTGTSAKTTTTKKSKTGTARKSMGRKAAAKRAGSREV